jgi:hypothetical protein
MGGATLDMATGQMQLNDRLGSMGLDRAYSVMEQLAAFMTRILAHTLMRNMYLIAHAVLRTQWNQPIAFKRGKTWLKTNPTQWQVRDAVTVNLGASTGERMRQAAVFDSLLGKQAMLAQNGMEEVLVNIQGFYDAATQWLRINDIDTPEKYFIDPRTPEAQQALKDRNANKQMMQMKQDAMMAQAIGLEQVRVALQKYQTDVDTQFKYYQTVLNAQIEEAKLAVKGVVDLVQARQIANKVQNDNSQSTAADDDSGAGQGGGTEPATQSTAGGGAGDSGD